MTDSERTEMVLTLRGADESGEGAAFHWLLKKATPSDLRHAIRECLLTPTSTCCNRRRMGRLANELLDRVLDEICTSSQWENRALDAEGRLKTLLEKAAEQAPRKSAEKPAKKGRGKG